MTDLPLEYRAEESQLFSTHTFIWSALAASKVLRANQRDWIIDRSKFPVSSPDRNEQKNGLDGFWALEHKGYKDIISLASLVDFSVFNNLSSAEKIKHVQELTVPDGKTIITWDPKYRPNSTNWMGSYEFGDTSKVSEKFFENHTLTYSPGDIDGLIADVKTVSRSNYQLLSNRPHSCPKSNASHSDEDDVERDTETKQAISTIAGEQTPQIDTQELLQRPVDCFPEPSATKATLNIWILSSTPLFNHVTVCDYVVLLWPKDAEEKNDTADYSWLVLLMETVMMVFINSYLPLGYNKHWDNGAVNKLCKSCEDSFQGRYRRDRQITHYNNFKALLSQDEIAWSPSAMYGTAKWCLTCYNWWHGAVLYKTTWRDTKDAGKEYTIDCCSAILHAQIGHKARSELVKNFVERRESSLNLQELCRNAHLLKVAIYTNDEVVR
ncbi:hypothetical protein BO78DRAFT_420497 [Aspergillus sclerotiicarbonarius CBS 121057]|uniref:Uncharacterized protein n=1 Tax=Aspergillus sclerotiicarbonarius (strain CBS 121057 / IBT 28362) TaxID=1448318 RepID=A0A319EDF9_ASPSB|nr:hypothetical protein BO78DRAFT_420497 [Aspergillus sclerotiicarbonarius CBS 121057]